MNFLLAIDKGDYSDAIIETKGLVETVLFGGKMLLIGMLAVFSVLCLIWVALSLFKLFFCNLDSKKRTSTINTDVETASLPVETVTCGDDEEIIAVIAAAIAAAECEAPGLKFRVVSFNRK